MIKEDKEVAIVFIEDLVNNCNCGVKFIRDKFIFDHNNYNTVDLKTNGNVLSFDKHLHQDFAFPENPKRIILFGHPDNIDYPSGIMYNGQPLSANWWSSNSNKKYDFIFALVCNGIEIFRNTHYKSVFPNAISFQIEIIIKSDDYSLEIWSGIFDDLLNCIKDDTENMLRNIKEIFCIAYLRAENKASKDYLDGIMCDYFSQLFNSIEQN
jgi:hypothetical protein